MEEHEDASIKRILNALSKASPNYELIGVQQSVQMATFKALKGKRLTKSFHFRVFEGEGSGHVEVFIGPGDPRIVEYKL